MTAVFELDQVSRWHGRTRGVNRISLRGNGAVTALVGANGSGKSTVLRLLAGVERPDEGRVTTLGGCPATSAAIRRRIGYQPGHDDMWNEYPVLAWVTTMARLCGLTAREASTAAQRELDALGLGPVSARRLDQLSKGMRQRVKLATALAHAPTLLLLDEPLDGLDPSSRAHALARLRLHLDRGGAIVLATHVLSDVDDLGPTLVYLAGGRVLAEGEVVALRAGLTALPHHLRVRCGDARAMAAYLLNRKEVVRTAVDDDVLDVWVRELGPGLAALADGLASHAIAPVRVEYTNGGAAAIVAHLAEHAR